MNINIDNNNESDDGKYHQEVEERLKWWAEKHAKTIEEAREEFKQFLSDKLDITDASNEDDDFMIEAAESFIVQRKMSGSSSTQSQNLIGYFVGVDSRVRDAQENKRVPAVSAAINNLDEAINMGLVARAYTENGVWMLETKQGVKKTEDSAEEKPWFLFEEHGLSIAILQNNPDWSRFGEPITPYRWQRTYHFYGNEEADYMDEQSVLRITVTSKDPNEWFVPQMWTNCTLKVRERKTVSPGWEDVYNALPFPSAVTYGDIVEEQYAAAIAPDKLIPTATQYVQDLSMLGELFETQQQMIAGIPNPVGPMVFIKGKVSDLRLEPSDYQYDPTGHTYFMRVTSWDLLRTFNEDPRSDVGIGIHGFLGDEGHPFEYATADGWKPYAIKTTVLIYGRLGMSVKEVGGKKLLIPKINAVGVHPIPRQTIPGGEGGDTNTNQFKGE